MSIFLQSIHRRTRALADKSAWLLMLPAGLIIWLLDEAMLKTIIEWLLVAPIMAGLTVILSRIIFPQVDLTRMIDEVVLENRAAAVVVAGLMAFCGLVFLALVLWARA